VTLITFVAQIFYAQAIWRVTKGKVMTTTITFLAVVCLALGIVTTIDIFTAKSNTFASKRFSIISGCVQGLAALNDLLITAGMCYHLRSNRGDLPLTSQFVDKLILYTVSRGILTALTQIIFLVTNVAFPGNTYFMPFHQAVGKFYVNSVLATLNMRQTSESKPDELFDTGPGYIFHADSEATGQSLSVQAESRDLGHVASGTRNEKPPDKEGQLEIQ